MDPRVWGPSGWFFMHSITLTYPDNPSDKCKEDMKRFFMCIGKVLPCYKCRNNFEDHLKKHPLDDKALSSREELIKWLIKIHNEVNRISGKPEITYQETVEKFINESNKFEKSDDQSNLFSIVIILVHIALLIFLIYLLR